MHYVVIALVAIAVVALTCAWQEFRKGRAVTVGTLAPLDRD